MQMFSSQFDPFSGGFSSSQSTDSGVSSAKSRDTQGLIPVTVKQISEASHSGDDKSNFQIDGVDVTNITLVGMVFDKSERVTDVSFALDDGTGRIECKRWVNEAFDTREMENIREVLILFFNFVPNSDGIYVRLNGHLRSSGGNRQLVAFSVRPVTNFDEIAFHFIEVIHLHLKNSKTRLPSDALTQPLSASVKTESTGYQTPSSQLSAQSVDGVNGLDQMVLDYLQQPSNYDREKGIHRDELSQQLKISTEKIMESIRTLEEEGLIYSTIDEFHYKSTTSG
ncbi:Replication protein A 32 kDa subunit A [Vitis vinifera]|uniref:Replication protein A 32 kDa subunit A n=1 Tax=Vitis vinifera TaxID=29760 RepID=A0A438EX59_VITVI|nr:Replication protein A 32 kDa subunit A [Vitis vinifera]